MNNVRKPMVAGLFYPSNTRKLKDELNLLLDIAKPGREYENVFGLVAPHAGYKYSGKTAAYAYNAARTGNYKKVIVISPSHRQYFAGVSVFAGNAYRTPLGDAVINKELTQKLIDVNGVIFEGTHGHGEEHALEVQIPFIQSSFGDVEIVPLVMGDQKESVVYRLAEAIAEAADEETLVVASSDLSHFYTKDTADKLDSLVEANINNFDYEKLLTDLNKRNCEACGGGPIAAMMKAAELKGYTKAEVLARTDSGDVTGDYTEVVGYLSAVVYK